MIISSIFPARCFAAGFTTRSDDLQSDEPTRRFAGNIFRVRQVHSSRIILIPEGERPQSVSGMEADAMVTSRAGILLTVWVADCVPVILGHKDGLCAAAVHAGWRGLAGRILPAAVDRIKSAFGLDPQDLFASVGPAIGPCCYEVGADVAHALARSCGDPSVISEEQGRHRADLPRIAELQLAQSSVKSENTEIADQCTRCNDDLFYSRRRGNITERQCGFIGIRRPL